MKRNFTKLVLSLFLCLMAGRVLSQTKLTGNVIANPSDGRENAAFDGNVGTFYDCGGPTGDNHGWVGLTLSSPAVIKKVRFYPRVDGTATWVLDKNDGGKFQGAHTADFSAPITLTTITRAQLAVATWTEIAISSTEKFEYVRYLAPDLSSSTSGITTSNCTVAEIEFYGEIPKVNIAQLATVTTSFVSPWESLEAVNDGFEPANSIDRPNGAYGNWNSSNTSRWLQYEWKKPATLTGTDIYWWTDGGGILLPTQSDVEYFNAATNTWVKIGDIGKVKDQYNYLAIDNIVTTKLRVNMLNETESTGVLEWKAYGTVPSDPPTTGKQVYIPREWTNTSANVPYDLTTRSAQSKNFLIVWGPLAGTDPKTNTNPELKFDPVVVLDSMEQLYEFYINKLHVVEERGNLAKYKLIVVMNNTWRAGLYTGWAFGGSFDNVIGAMFIDPRTMNESSWVTSHEINHSFQAMIPVLYPGKGFTGVSSSGFFWETHANFMAVQYYPNFITNTDYPRAMNFTNYYFGSPRKHYGDWFFLQYLKDKQGLPFINRIWQEADPSKNEHPTQTVMRLLNKTQPEMNDMMLDYAMRRVKGDFSNQKEILKAEASIDRQYIWKKTTILDSVGEDNFAIPDRLAPQQYGFNTIRLFPKEVENCPDKYVYLNFKGQSGVNASAGWRYGFVSVDANGTSTYGDVLNSDGETIYKVPSNSTELYLVVLGAPKNYSVHLNNFEVGFAKLPRFPYQISVKGAYVEGYEPTFRHRSLPAGAKHPNGGGFVASTAHVDATAYVGPNALVTDRARVTGTARIEGKAWIRDDARVSGNAVVSDFAMLSINASASGNAKVYEQAQLYGGTVISENAKTYGNAVLFSNTLSGSAQAYGNALSMSGTFSGTFEMGGDAEIGGTCSSGKYLQIIGATSDATRTPRSACDGLVTHELNVDVNNAYTRFTDSQMAFKVNYACGKEAANLPSRTLTFPPIGEKRIGDANFDPFAVSNSNEAISYTSKNPEIITVVGNKLSIVAAGTTTITATVPQNSAFANKPSLSQSVTVLKGLQSIQMNMKDKVGMSIKKTPLEVSSSSGLPVSVSIDKGWVALINGNELEFKSAGSATITATQLGNDRYEAATVIRKQITIVMDGNELITVPKSLSPNNDGINDVLRIEGIANYPENSLVIISALGQTVYKANGYGKSEVFDGRGTDGTRLPAGTYFYVVRLKDNNAWQVVKGYFTLAY